MCRSRLAALLLLLSFSLGAHAATRLSLLLGDTATRQASAVARELTSSSPALADTDIAILSGTGDHKQLLARLAGSDVIVVQAVGRTVIDALRDELAAAIDRGARVYAYGASANRDDAAMGIVVDTELERYFGAGGAANLRNGLLYLLARAGKPVQAAPPQAVPDNGLYDAGTGTWTTDYASFLRGYQNHRPGRPWVGLVLYQSNVVAGITAHYDALIGALEARGFNVLPVFGYPPEEPVRHYFLDADGRSRVEAVVAASMKIGIKPEVLGPLLEQLDVPVLNAVSLYVDSPAQWQASAVGMDMMERSWQLALPEMGGFIQPTVFAAKERIIDPASGAEYVEERPIPERVARLADRVARWIELRHKPNRDKRVLLHYFNFPAGRDGIGASYLNVVPESLWSVLQRLKEEGYDTSGMPSSPTALRDEVIRYGANLPAAESGEIDALARSGEAVLLPVDTYEKWFAKLPQAARDEVIGTWGSPRDNTLMAWSDADGRRHFVLPVRRYGNVLLAPQPVRGTTDDPEKAYHDVRLPPPHSYIAFYLWLHEAFGADAMFQFGAHGTHEWLPGREAGMGPEDAPDYLIRDLPNLYAFIMDNTGEGTIAMRRGMASMITHLTPPFDRAALNPELMALDEAIHDYMRAAQQSPLLAQQRGTAILATAMKLGVLADLGVDGPAAHDAAELIDTLHEYLEELAGRPTPFGLHSFGVAPEERYIESTAEAIAAQDASLDEAARRLRIGELKQLLRESASRELDALVAGLAGRYIPAGLGGDPLRTPAALPTGRNFHSFDPRRIPDRNSYALGSQLASELIEDYRRRHGEYPDKLGFTLWGVETMRHEGVQEAQIMSLMGVRPVYDAAGSVRGIVPIPRDELGRPRIDVTIIPSGLYRDMFSNVVALLDEAASVAQAQEEADNFLRRNSMRTRNVLEARGIAPELAARMAAVRLFSVPPGAYGTQIETLVDRSDTWEEESQVADVYFMRMSHLYGQGFWGAGEAAGTGVAGLGRELLENALAGTRMTVHARSSNVYQVLDGDDPYASFGGLSLAVRAVDGMTPEVMISNLADPSRARQETLERFMGRELRSRYLNPQWIEAMQQEGYAGAKFINQVVQNLWGWQVTVPEAVDAAKWQELYETYVQDRHDLGMEAFFRDANNLEALQALMERMLEAVRKGYWEADEAVVQELGERSTRLGRETGRPCTLADCSALGTARAGIAPGSGAAPQAHDAAGTSAGLQPVQGFLIEEVTREAAAADPAGRWLRTVTILLMLLALAAGYLRAYPAGPWPPRRPR